MLNLMDLARKWLRPLIAGAELSPAEMAERDAFNAEVSKVWLDYTGNEDWAKRKLAAGLNLTPEALEYMTRELARRKAVADAHAETMKELKDEQTEIPADGRGLQPGDGERIGPATGGGSESGRERPLNTARLVTSDGLSSAANDILARTGHGIALPNTGARSPRLAGERGSDVGRNGSQPAPDAPAQTDGGASPGPGDGESREAP